MSFSQGGRRQGSRKLKLNRWETQWALAQADPDSPPDTPTTSPQHSRKGRHPRFAHGSGSTPHDVHLQPIGSGHQFSYRPFIVQDGLSPRSPSSSDVADDLLAEDLEPSQSRAVPARPAVPGVQSLSEGDSESEEEADESDVDADTEDDNGDGDDGEDEDDSEPEKDVKRPTVPLLRRVEQDEITQDDDEDGEDEDKGEDGDVENDEDDESEHEEDRGSDSSQDNVWEPTIESPVYATVKTTTTVCNFTLEDMDPMDSDNGLDVLRPYEIESSPSRSSSKQREPMVHRELPIRMMQDLKNLNCSNDPSDDDEAEPDPDAEEEAFYKWQQHMRRRRVSLSSSIGKRTFSERSESDDEDDAGLDVNEVGSSARRLRKRINRGSLLFQDPPEPRIDELEEPNSSEDEYLTSQHLGMELPYWTIEINEMNDSS